MKTLKKLFIPAVLIICLLFGMTACSTDTAAMENKLAELQAEIAELEETIAAYEKELSDKLDAARSATRNSNTSIPSCVTATASTGKISNSRRSGSYGISSKPATARRRTSNSSPSNSLPTRKRTDSPPSRAMRRTENSITAKGANTWKPQTAHT